MIKNTIIFDKAEFTAYHREMETYNQLAIKIEL